MAEYSKIHWSESFREEVRTMTGFGDAIFRDGIQRGLQQGQYLSEKAIVEYMTAKGDYTREAIAAITGIPLETIEEILEAVGAVEAPATKAE